MYAVIRLRGSVNLSVEKKDTLEKLRLKAVNNCVIVPKNPTFDGMLKKVKDCITWGEVKDDVLNKLILKRGRLQGDKKLDEKKTKEVSAKILKDNSTKNVEIKKIFRLSPASKGLKSIKSNFPKGDLGNRGDEINKLLERMI